MSRSRGPAAAAGLGALLILLALIAGLPVLLYRLGGSPLPGHLPGAAAVGHALLHRDSASLVLAAVRDVSWIAWALFTLAVLAEVQAVLRRRTAPRLRLGGMQAAAGRLVALAALTFTVAPVGTLLATPQPAATVLQADVTSAPAPHVTTLPRVPQPVPPATAAPARPPEVRPGPGIAPPAPAPARHARRTPGEPAFAAGPQAETVAAVASAGAAGAGAGSARPAGAGVIREVTVRPGDCLWSIAQQRLGRGDLFREIVALNLGHDMGDGQVLTNPSVIQPGWVLRLPAWPRRGGTWLGRARRRDPRPRCQPGRRHARGPPDQQPVVRPPAPVRNGVRRVVDGPGGPALGRRAGRSVRPGPGGPGPVRSGPVRPAPSAPAPAASVPAAGQVTPVSPVASTGLAQDSRAPGGIRVRHRGASRRCGRQPGPAPPPAAAVPAARPPDPGAGQRARGPGRAAAARRRGPGAGDRPARGPQPPGRLDRRRDPSRCPR